MYACIPTLIGRRSKWVLVAVLLVTLVAGLLATRVRFENAIETWFIEDDPALATYQLFSDQFAADELVVIAVRAQNLFTPEAYAALGRLIRAAQQAPHVHLVRSLLDFTHNVDEDDNWSERRRLALESSLVSGNFLSGDMRTTAILVEVERSGNTVEGKRALVSALRKAIEGEAGTGLFEIHMTGTPVLDDTALSYNERDLLTLYPLLLPFVFAVGWLVFRSPVLALVPLAVVIGTTLLALGFMGALGIRSTLLTSAMIPLFLAIGVADAVHLVSAYHQRCQSGADRSRAVEAVLNRLWAPCLFTSLSSAAGFAALMSSSLKPVREFGLVAAFGVLAAFVLTMTLVPAVLALRLPGRGAGSPHSGWVTRLVPVLARPPKVLVRSSLLVALGILMLAPLAAGRLETGVDPMSWFRAADPFRVATEVVDRELGGGAAVEFLIRGPRGALRDPRNLQQLDDFERWLEAQTPVTHALSLVDILKEAVRLSSEGEMRVPRLPATPMVTSLLLDGLSRSGELQRWVDTDFSVARISARLRLGNATDLGPLLERLEREIAGRFGAGPLQVALTGYGVLAVRMEAHLIETQIRSLVIAFVVVFLMLGFLLRSLRLTLVAIVPNLLPLLVGMALMPVLGISLNPGTVMVAAVALGIVVDDSVHLLCALKRHLATLSPGKDPIAAAIEEVGHPVIVTSLVLIGCMALLTLGHFAPSAHFGAVVAVIAASAVLADLLLLPALLRVTNYT